MNKSIKIILITILALWLFSSLCSAQTKPTPLPPEKQFYIPFTQKQLIDLNAQMSKADSSAINGHNVMPGFNLLHLIINVFNQAYNEQNRSEVKKDTVKKGGKP